MPVLAALETSKAKTGSSITLSRTAGERLVRPSAPIPDRHRNAGDLHLDRAEVVAAGEIEGLPVVAAEGDIGRGRRAVHDAAELLALGVHDPDAAGAAA